MLKLHRPTVVPGSVFAGAGLVGPLPNCQAVRRVDAIVVSGIAFDDSYPITPSILNMRFQRLRTLLPNVSRQPRKQRGHRRRLGFEALEARRVLAAVISEVHISPLFGSNDIDQYVELRGAANHTLAVGTYFVTLEGWGAVPGGAGYIHSVIDVSGVTLGSNGFLTITQFGSLYSVDPASARLTSNLTGFAGLPDGRWSDASTLSDRLAFIAGSNSFLLVQTATKPVPGTDADSNDDGVLDGPAAQWSVLDSVGLLNSTAGTSRSYGRITFSESVNALYSVGTTFVLTEGGGYVARIGASEGWSANEWVSGTTIEDGVTPGSLYRFTYGTFGDPQPLVYSGRSINHLGTFNFDGGFRGFVGIDSNGDGNISDSETPLPGVSVFADRNGNGVRDSFEVEVIAAAQVLDAELTNRFPNATLTVADDRNENIGFAVRTRSTFDPEFNVIRVFSSEGIPWFDNDSRLKVMFYQEADFISVEAIAAETLTASYGRIDVYDRNNTLLGSTQSGALAGLSRQTISIQRPTADIKYAVIYTNENMPNSSPFGKFDKLQYAYPEFQDISDANGRFAVDELYGNRIGTNQPSGYSLTLDTYPGDMIPLDSNTNPSLSVLSTEHRLSTRFGFRANALPEIQTSQLLVIENPATNAVVGKIAASDTDPGQVLTYRFVGSSGPFAINPLNGDVTFTNTSRWDFETNVPIVVTVEVADSLPTPGKAIKQITITPIDANEAPVISPAAFSVAEGTSNGTVIGTVVANDPDGGEAGQFSFSLGPTNPLGVFAIHPQSGVLSVLSSGLLDFETRSLISVPVIATDRGSPVQSSTRTVTVTVTDVNEPPTQITFANVVSVPENTNIANTITVANLQLVDDALGAVVWALSGQDAGSFTILGQQLRFKSQSPLDFETKPQFVVVVSADDPAVGNTPDVSATFTLQISDVNEPPRGIQFNNVVSPLVESTNVASAVRVADIQVLDDTVGTNTLSLGSTLDAANFTLVGTELRFRSTTPLDFETKSSYRVVVQADDPAFIGFPDVVTTFTLTIGDANDPPTDVRFTNSINSIAETNGVSAGQALATIVITDDTVGTNEVTLAGADAAAFEVVGNQLRLRTGTLLDFEAKPFYQVTVRVNDPTLLGSNGVERAFRVNVANRAEVSTLTDLQGQPLTFPVRNARLTWDTELGGVEEGAIRVLKKDLGDRPVSFTWQVGVVGDRTVVDLEFNGSLVGPDGLTDGVYEVLVDGTKTTTFGVGATGLDYRSAALAVLSPLPVGRLQITGPGLLRAGVSGTYQWSLTELPNPQPQSVEYRIDFQGDGVIDQTVTGGINLTLSPVVYAMAGTNTMMVQARVAGAVVAVSHHVVNVTPETTESEDWLLAFDADRDNSVSPLDVLVIINRINSASNGTPPYLLDHDTDRDGSVSPLDVLTVINYLNTSIPQRTPIFVGLVMAESGGLPGITNDLSFSGQIVGASRSLFVSLDGGDKKDLSQYVQSDGRFAIQDAALAQLFGGVADGPHTLSLMTQTDGVYSAAMDKRFLSLRSPLKEIELTSLVVSGGTVRTAWTSAALGAKYDLWLSFNGGAPQKVRSQLAGTSVVLGVEPGSYVLSIEATDAAGNRSRSSDFRFSV